MSFILYQGGYTALHRAASNGNIDIARLLLDKGAVVNMGQKVSDMIWEIVLFVCVSDWFITIMICDGSVMVMSTSQR